MKKEQDLVQTQLTQELAKLSKSISMQNSLKYNFVRGLFFGLGTFLGTTIFVALIVYILSKLTTISVLEPFINQIVDIVQNPSR